MDAKLAALAGEQESSAIPGWADSTEQNRQSTHAGFDNTDSAQQAVMRILGSSWRGHPGSPPANPAGAVAVSDPLRAVVRAPGNGGPDETSMTIGQSSARKPEGVLRRFGCRHESSRAMALVSP